MPKVTLRDAMPDSHMRVMVVFEAKPHVLPLTDAGHLSTMSEVLLGAPSAALLSGETFSLADAAGTTLIASAGLIEVLLR